MPTPPTWRRRLSPLLTPHALIAAMLAALVALALVARQLDTPAPGALREDTAQPAIPSAPARVAKLGNEPASAEVRQVANWIAGTRDAAGSEFVIVDKKNARVYVFDAEARLRAASPVLLGAAHGDDSVPGIGTRPIPQVKPEERTTPAGRFVAEPGHNSAGEDIVWIDYDAAVSMHRVRATVAAERRLERLASPDSADNRISYGCINVPPAFYDQHVRPAFAGKRGIVYVLPEVKSITQVFGVNI